MTDLHYRLLNVFTRDGATLSGNPLCVFEDGRDLDTHTMQALARQFNLSETTFILPSTSAAAQVRIFTPEYEMPFAGHPTLGTAQVCRALGLGGTHLQLQMQAGLIQVSQRDGRWTLQAPAVSTRPCEHSSAQLARMLGLNETDIHAPALWVNAGREQLMLALRSEDAVRRATARPDELNALRSEHGAGMVYLFAPNDSDQWLARFFFQLGEQVVEDPATGSAAANLGGWLLATGSRHSAVQIRQGEQIARPSTLWLQVDDSGCIHVGGEVIELGRGSLRL